MWLALKKKVFWVVDIRLTCRVRWIPYLLGHYNGAAETGAAETVTETEDAETGASKTGATEIGASDSAAETLSKATYAS